MSRPERLEDLGRIREILSVVIEDFDCKLSHHLNSKHAFDDFYTAMKDMDFAEDVHRMLRYHKDRLEEISYIAIGCDEN